MLTLAVENLHAVSHFKDQTQTMLQYVQNLGNTVYEGLNRVVKWGAYYFTCEDSYYPVPDTEMSHIDITEGSSLVFHLKPVRPLSNVQRDEMREWENVHGKCVRQNICPSRNNHVSGRNMPSQHVQTECSQTSSSTCHFLSN